MARRNQRSAEAKEYRKLYKTVAWKRRRLAQLSAKPLCERCQAKGRITPATVVDHIAPHHGDEALFFDAENLQSLCDMHHNSWKQRLERRGYDTELGDDGWPICPNHPVNKAGR